MVPWSVTLTDR